MNLETMKFLALEEAMKSCSHFQHASLIIYKRQVVALGHNDSKHHSEENAIENLRRLLCGKGV